MPIRKILIVINLALVLILAWVLARTVRFRDINQNTNTPVKQNHGDLPCQESSPTPPNAINYDDILAGDLFSRTNSSATGSKTSESGRSNAANPSDNEKPLEEVTKDERQASKA